MHWKSRAMRLSVAAVIALNALAAFLGEMGPASW